MAYDNMISRTDADALMPTDVAREIIKAAPAQSAALSLMRRTTMSSKQTRMPVLSALAQAYWVGGDTGLKQTTKLAWGNKYLIAEELAAIVPIPTAVLDDADYDIWAEVRPSLTEAAGALIDEAVLFGTNKPAAWTAAAIVPGAIAAGNSIDESAHTGDLTVDISDVMALVEADGFDVNGFAADTAIKGGLRGLRTTEGAMILQGPVGADLGTLYNERVAYINNGAWDVATARVIAGDWRQAIIAIRQDITYTIHTEGVISDDEGNIILNLMQQDSAAMRMVMRVAYQVANPINRKQQVEANRFPFGVLVP